MNTEDFLQSLERCSEKQRKAIEDHRLEILKTLKNLRGDRTDIGIWAPACVQHVYLPYPFANDPSIKSGSSPSLNQIIDDFLDDPQDAPVYITEDPWLADLGCSGVNFTNVAHMHGLLRDYYRWRRYQIMKKRKNSYEKD